MIDRFINLVGLVSSNKKNPSLITKWKILHRKYEILSELKKKTEFSAQDIYNYVWVGSYTGEYTKQIHYPNGFNIKLVGKYVRIEFNEKGVYPKFIVSIDGDGRKPDDIEIIYEQNTLYHYFLSYNKIDTADKIDKRLFNILKELFIYMTSNAIDRAIKGE